MVHGRSVPQPPIDIPLLGLHKDPAAGNTSSGSDDHEVLTAEADMTTMNRVLLLEDVDDLNMSFDSLQTTVTASPAGAHRRSGHSSAQSVCGIPNLVAAHEARVQTPSLTFTKMTDLDAQTVFCPQGGARCPLLFF